MPRVYLKVKEVDKKVDMITWFTCLPVIKLSLRVLSEWFDNLLFLVHGKLNTIVELNKNQMNYYGNLKSTLSPFSFLNCPSSSS